MSSKSFNLKRKKLKIGSSRDVHEIRIKQIAEISRNARTAWFGMIGVLLYCGVILLDVSDRDFFEYGASAQLPILNVSVPVVGFFTTAPILVLGFYVYLHVYLSQLWEAVEKAPLKFKGLPLRAVAFPWLILDAAIRLKEYYHGVKVWSSFGWFSTVISYALGWFFAPIILMAFWIRSWPYHNKYLTIFLAILLISSFWIGKKSWTERRRAMRNLKTIPSNSIRGYATGIFLSFILIFVSLEASVGGLLHANSPSWVKSKFEENFSSNRFWILDESSREGIIFIWPTNLQGAEISSVPDSWIGRDQAWKNFKDNNNDDLKVFSEYRDIEIKKAKSRSFKKSNLKKSVLIDTFAAGVDFSGSDFSGASLYRSNFEGANLSNSNMNYTDLRWAVFSQSYMKRSQFFYSIARQVDFSSANLENTSFYRSDFKRSFFEGTVMTAAEFKKTDLENCIINESELYGVIFDETKLSEVVFSNSYLKSSNFISSNITSAKFLKSDLRFSKFENVIAINASFIGSNLRDAEFYNVDISGAQFTYSNLSSIDFSDSEISQTQLNTTFGNMSTKLPKHINRPSHWSKSEDWWTLRTEWCDWLKIKNKENYCPIEKYYEK